jgi:cyclohexanone monooxygenase
VTGFDLYGRDGTALSEHWGQGTRSLHGLMTDKFPNLFIIGGNQHSVMALNAVHLLDEQSVHVSYVIGEAKRRKISAIEPSVASVDEYTNFIRTSPQDKELVVFYADCTPGYYNNEGNVKKGEDLFSGQRYGPGAMAFYGMLADWRATGDLEGMEMTTATGTPHFSNTGPGEGDHMTISE